MSSYSDLASQIINKDGKGGKFSGLNTFLDVQLAFKQAQQEFEFKKQLQSQQNKDEFEMKKQLETQQGRNAGYASIINSSNLYGEDPTRALGQFNEAMNNNGVISPAQPIQGANNIASGGQSEVPTDVYTTETPGGFKIGDNSSNAPSNRNESFLQQLAQYNPGRAATIKAMADYRGDPIKLGGRMGQALLNQVNQYDPNFDASKYKERQTFINTNWNKGDLFKNRQAIENVVQHLDLLQTNFDKMNNGQLLIANAAGNKLKVQGGEAAVTNAMVDAKAVGTEMAKVLRGGGILNEQEQKDTQDQLTSASSPEQLHGAVEQMIKLTGPRINSALETYKNVMGDYPHGAFSPELIDSLRKLSPSVYNDVARKLGREPVSVPWDEKGKSNSTTANDNGNDSEYQKFLEIMGQK